MCASVVYRAAVNVGLKQEINMETSRTGPTVYTRETMEFFSL